MNWRDVTSDWVYGAPAGGGRGRSFPDSHTESNRVILSIRVHWERPANSAGFGRISCHQSYQLD